VLAWLVSVLFSLTDWLNCYLGISSVEIQTCFVRLHNWHKVLKMQSQCCSRFCVQRLTRNMSAFAATHVTWS